MSVGITVVVAGPVFIHLRIRPVVHTGGVRILAAESPQVPALIARIRISGRQARASGGNETQQTRIALAGRHGLLLYAHQQVNHSAVGSEIAEHAVVARRTFGSRRTNEERPFGNRTSVTCNLLEIGHILRHGASGAHQLHADGIVKCLRRKIIVDYPVADGHFAAFHHGKCAYNGIFGNGAFDLKELKFKGNVPVNRELAGPHLHTVLLLFEAQESHRHHHIDCTNYRIGKPPASGEKARRPARELKDHRPEHLEQHGHRAQQREERQIHKQSINRQTR